MLHLRSLREGLPLFRALGSDVRIRILEVIAQSGRCICRPLQRLWALPMGR